MLYLISTPIGHLADLTYRAVDILKKCDYILCEDTRHSSVLMAHYGITTHLKSFHKFNESQAEDCVISDLRASKTIALISDAGTPLISDPGHQLIQRCHAEKLAVSALPGPCALIDALVLSGFDSTLFQFIGFLPKKEQQLRGLLSKALLYCGTSIAYESPNRIEETLKVLLSLDPQRILCIARELTKLHEECLIDTAEKLLSHFQTSPPRGEMVLLIHPPAEKIAYENFSLQELVSHLQETLHLDKKEAIKMAAQMHHLPKREVYKHFTND